MAKTTKKTKSTRTRPSKGADPKAGALLASEGRVPPPWEQRSIKEATTARAVDHHAAGFEALDPSLSAKNGKAKAPRSPRAVDPSAQFTVTSKSQARRLARSKPLERMSTGERAAIREQLGPDEANALGVGLGDVAAGRTKLFSDIRAELANAPRLGNLNDLAALMTQNRELFAAVDGLTAQVKALAASGSLTGLPWTVAGEALQPSATWAAQVALLAVDFRARVEMGKPNKGFKLFLAGLRDLTELERLDAVRVARAAVAEVSTEGAEVAFAPVNDAEPDLTPGIGDVAVLRDGSQGKILDMMGNGPGLVLRLQMQDGREEVTLEAVERLIRRKET